MGRVYAYNKNRRKIAQRFLYLIHFFFPIQVIILRKKETIFDRLLLYIDEKSRSQLSPYCEKRKDKRETRPPRDLPRLKFANCAARITYCSPLTVMRIKRGSPIRLAGQNGRARWWTRCNRGPRNEQSYQRTRLMYLMSIISDHLHSTAMYYHFSTYRVGNSILPFFLFFLFLFRTYFVRRHARRNVETVEQ